MLVSHTRAMLDLSSFELTDKLRRLHRPTMRGCIERQSPSRIPGPCIGACLSWNRRRFCCHYEGRLPVYGRSVVTNEMTGQGFRLENRGLNVGKIGLLTSFQAIISSRVSGTYLQPNRRASSRQKIHIACSSKGRSLRHPNFSII
jgi:hypothetical protein